MFCMNCGKELPDGANFCLRCGKPQKAGVQALIEEEPQWETCEISYYQTHEGWTPNACRFRFYASAIGSKGKYTAKETSELKGDPSDGNWRFVSTENQIHIDAAHNNLVAHLVRDGWEPLTRGQYWYSERFRRRVLATAPVKEQTEFDVILTDPGNLDFKLFVIKVVRELTDLSFKEAKDLVETTPKPIKSGVSKDEAEAARAMLEAVSARVDIR